MQYLAFEIAQIENFLHNSVTYIKTQNTEFVEYCRFGHFHVVFFFRILLENGQILGYRRNSVRISAVHRICKKITQNFPGPEYNMENLSLSLSVSVSLDRSIDRSIKMAGLFVLKLFVSVVNFKFQVLKEHKLGI